MTERKIRPRYSSQSRSLLRLKTKSLRCSSPLASPPILASPIQQSRDMDFSSSLKHLITMPRHIDEPLVTFLLRSVFKFPLVFDAVQTSVALLSHDGEMQGFVDAYGEEAAEALIFVAFLYAMGIDLQSKYGIEAPNGLPHDLTFRETVGMLHLAELFDLEPLRRASKRKIKRHFSQPLPPQEFEWAFDMGAKITGALNLSTEMPLKIALAEQYTRLWDRGMSQADEERHLDLGRENVEFYLLIKSYCLGHVNEKGINDISPAFLSKWMSTVRNKSMCRLPS